MRFSTTVLVAIQASMGLAHAIPPPSTKYLDKIDNRIEEDNERRGHLAEFRKKFFKGYEVAKSTTRHTFLVPEDNEYESKKHHHDNEHGTTNYHPYDHESEDRHDMKNKYEPQRHHVSEKPHYKTHHPEGDYNHEEHYHHSESYDNPKTGHHHNDYNYETEYPSEEHKYKKDYPTGSFDPSDDRYNLNEHDLDKYFIKDHDTSSKKHESDDIGDSPGSPFKRWTSNGDMMGQWWHPGQSKEYYRDPNKEHTHSHKYKVEPRLPDTTGPRRFIHDLNKAKEHDLHMRKPGYYPHEKYEAELEDQKYSHFNKHEQENDNRPYFDKYPEKYPPKQPFEQKRKFVPKAEYGGEADTHHSYAKEHYKKPDYEKEDEEKYGPGSEEKYHKEEYSEKKESNSKLKGFYDFNFGHNPEEGKFLDDESYTTKHGGSGEPEETAFKKYYPKKSDREDKEGDSNAARKYGYRKYHPKKQNSSHEEKKHDHKEEEEKLNYSEENNKHAYKKVYYPSQYEPKENTKFYRKQEVGHEDHAFKAKPHRVEHHTHYYDEPGYENVVPGFMWAGPGTVTKTPCASKEGCPYGHWHMLEPKDGEHRRIGITGTNIVVEPDYSRLDFKEDTVNHVLPGYEKVIPGFEWAGPGRVTEVPCPSVTDCPQGGWFMLAPRYGEHRRIAMNYPKATPTPHPHPHPHPHPQPHSTMHFPQPGYEPPTPVRYEGRAQDKDHDENERGYKLIHRHSSHMGKRSIEARTPCGKKKGPKAIKKLDPNKPLPTLTIQQLWNFERLNTAKRKEIVTKYPWMDEELKKEYLKTKFLTPSLITKLNEFWGTLFLDRQANMLFIEVMKRKPVGVPRKRATPELSEGESSKIETLSKRADPVLSKDQIKRIEALAPFIRRIAAGNLDFNPKLTEELVNARGKFSAKLIAKLNKEYARIKKDPKYKDLLKTYLPNSKKAKRKEKEGEKFYLSKDQIKRIEGSAPFLRRIAAGNLDFNPKLTEELANARGKFSTKLIAKLNKEYTRIMRDPKYKDLRKTYLPNSKKAKRDEEKFYLEKEEIKMIEDMNPFLRRSLCETCECHQRLTFKLVNAPVPFSQDLIDKLNVQLTRLMNDWKWGMLRERYVDAPRFQRRKKAKEAENAKDDERSRKAEEAKAKDAEEAKKAKEANGAKKATTTNSKRSEPQLSEREIKKIEGLSYSIRGIVAKKLDLSPELTAELVKTDKLSDELIAKLNVEYARVKSDPKYNDILDKFFSNSKREDIQLPKKAIEKIEQLPPRYRAMVAQQLDLDPKTTKELVTYSQLSKRLIKKLNVEYHRIKKDPKYKDILDKFLSSSKREEPKLSEAMLTKIIRMDPRQRRWVAEMLDMDPKLTEELVKSDKMTDELVAKLNVEYARVYKDPKYAGLLLRMRSLYKRRGDGKDYFGCSVDDFYAFEPMSYKERKEWLILRGTEEKIAEELASTERWTQADIEKLEVEYQRFKATPKYRRIHYGNPDMDPYEPFDRKVKRESEAPGITQKQLETIKGMSTPARKIALRQLGVSQELSEKVAYADEFSPELIEKLDKEYRRIKSDPKYNAVLKKFGNNKTKRDSYHKENNDHEKRQLVPSTMNISQTEPDSDWEVDLSQEFKYAQALTEEFIERFGEMIYDKVGEAKKQKKQQSADDSAKGDQQAKVNTEATSSFNATKALNELIAGNSNETVSSQNATGLTAPQATGNLNTTKLLEPQEAAGQNGTEIAADQPVSNQTSTDGELKDKLEQSKKNGWCNEFLGGLEDTLKESVEAAQEEVTEAAETTQEKLAEAAETAQEEVAEAVKKDNQNET